MQGNSPMRLYRWLIGAALIIGALMVAPRAQTVVGRVGQSLATLVDATGGTLSVSSGRLAVLADVNNPSATTARNNAIVEGCVASDAAVSDCQPVEMGGRASTALPTAVSADGDAVPWRMNPNGHGYVAAAPQSVETFAATTAAFTPAATATDLCVITGHPSATIRVLDVRISGVATATEPENIFLVKRSAANTGGTFVAATAIPYDSADVSVDPTVGHYTANPTINGTVGTVAYRKVSFNAAASAVSKLTENLLSDSPLAKPIVLRGAAQQLAINFAGAALPAGAAGWVCHLVWTEE